MPHRAPFNSVLLPAGYRALRTVAFCRMDVLDAYRVKRTLALPQTVFCLPLPGQLLPVISNPRFQKKKEKACCYWYMAAIL
jgi:hypothetical protein